MSSTATKRKSTGTSGRPSKKTRTENNHDVTRAVVSDILADPDAYPVPEDDVEIRKLLVNLAQYARALEGQVAASASQEKSKENLEAATEKIRKAAAAGIKKQMSVCSISKGLSSRHSHHSRIVYSGNLHARPVPPNGFTTVFALTQMSSVTLWAWTDLRSGRQRNSLLTSSRS